MTASVLHLQKMHLLIKDEPDAQQLYASIITCGKNHNEFGRMLICKSNRCGYLLKRSCEWMCCHLLM